MRSKTAIRRVSALIALTLATATIAVPALASSPLVQISSDPYKNPTSQHRTQVEPDTYSFGSTIVSTFQTGRFYNGCASNIGWSTSTDNGSTWTHGFLPGTTVFAGGKLDRVSDPVVAYDAKHQVWMISYLACYTAGHPAEVVKTDFVVSRSRDGGLTWDRPIIVKRPKPGQFFDKNWTTCDNFRSSPFYGRCYSEFDNAASQPFDRILMTTSRDGGKTWGPLRRTADRGNGLAGQPVVQPNGTVVVPILRFPTERTFDMGSFVSRNGGRSWSRTVRISSLQTFFGPASVRNPQLPSANVDGSGRVYVVWSDCRFEPRCKANDIVISTSRNGLSWSQVRRIPTAPRGSGRDHFTPGLGAGQRTYDGKAHLGLAYYYFSQAGCATATCRLHVGFISSTNSGRTWSHSEHLAGPMRLPWLALTNQGYMYGDYISTSINKMDYALPVFAVARPPSGGKKHEAMFTTRQTILPITGGSLSTHNEKPAGEAGAGRSGSASGELPQTSH
jgi:hypothetical protein